jgi:hypothetical protein
LANQSQQCCPKIEKVEELVVEGGKKHWGHLKVDNEREVPLGTHLEVQREGCRRQVEKRAQRE